MLIGCLFVLSVLLCDLLRNRFWKINYVTLLLVIEFCCKGNYMFPFGVISRGEKTIKNFIFFLQWILLSFSLALNKLVFFIFDSPHTMVDTKAQKAAGEASKKANDTGSVEAKPQICRLQWLFSPPRCSNYSSVDHLMTRLPLLPLHHLQVSFFVLSFQ